MAGALMLLNTVVANLYYCQPILSEYGRDLECVLQGPR